MRFVWPLPSETCPAWVTLPGDAAPAGIALEDRRGAQAPGPRQGGNPSQGVPYRPLPYLTVPFTGEGSEPQAQPPRGGRGLPYLSAAPPRLLGSGVDPFTGRGLLAPRPTPSWKDEPLLPREFRRLLRAAPAGPSRPTSHLEGWRPAPLTLSSRRQGFYGLHGGGAASSPAQPSSRRGTDPTLGWLALSSGVAVFTGW